MKLSNLAVQIEKEGFFHHLLGLGANMGQIDDSKKVYRISDVTNNDNTTFINVEKFVWEHFLSLLLLCKLNKKEFEKLF